MTSDIKMTKLPEGGKLLMSGREAAAALSICEKSLWNHTVPRGTIPCVKIGARTLYDPRDLAAEIERRKDRGAG